MIKSLHKKLATCVVNIGDQTTCRRRTFFLSVIPFSRSLSAHELWQSLDSQDIYLKLSKDILSHHLSSMLVFLFGIGFENVEFPENMAYFRFLSLIEHSSDPPMIIYKWYTPPNVSNMLYFRWSPYITMNHLKKWDAFYNRMWKELRTCLKNWHT